MSQNSFPRREHVAALQATIETLGEAAGLTLRIEESGLDRYRCQYRLKVICPGAGWSEEIQVHFQIAEKLLTEGKSDQLDRHIAKLLSSHNPKQTIAEDH